MKYYSCLLVQGSNEYVGKTIFCGCAWDCIFNNSKLLGPAPETLMQYWANNNPVQVYSQCSKWIA